ncbi:MAG: hypothetical protein HP496_03295 [Nitrospira sp.]|nr:hypothetical protein [Nitrospira sp.]
MTVTGTYDYFIRFARGSAEIVSEIMGQLGLEQALRRAHCIPGHRIVIEAHEDRSDPYETGAALRRLDVLRHHFIAGSVKEERLELQIHAENCCPEESSNSEWRRRADIYLVPRVASLFPDIGGQLLSLRKYRGLESARAATFEDDDTTCKKLEGKYTQVEWKRILGHETLREWLEAGAYHPHFVSAGLNIGPKYH